jgi:hypothetical protein
MADNVEDGAHYEPRFVDQGAPAPRLLCGAKANIASAICLLGTM